MLVSSLLSSDLKFFPMIIKDTNFKIVHTSYYHHIKRRAMRNSQLSSFIFYQLPEFAIFAPR